MILKYIATAQCRSISEANKKLSCCGLAAIFSIFYGTIFYCFSYNMRTNNALASQAKYSSPKLMHNYNLTKSYGCVYVQQITRTHSCSELVMNHGQQRAFHLPSYNSITVCLATSVSNWKTIGIHREENVNECWIKNGSDQLIGVVLGQQIVDKVNQHLATHNLSYNNTTCSIINRQTWRNHRMSQKPNYHFIWTEIRSPNRKAEASRRSNVQVWV